MCRIAVRCTLLLVVMWALGACGPRARIAPEFNVETTRSIAFLPASYPTGVRKERIDIIRSLAISELSNSGFVVLDQAIVNKVCPNSECCSAESGACPERAKLAKEYGVNYFVDLSVASIARNDFLAGYFNSIDGSLNVTDVAKKPLVNVDHLESERGGLLFNSGQVFQGAISAYKNFGEDESFERLASKFAKALVSKVPTSKQKESAPQQAEVKIQEVEVKPVQPAVYSVCVLGTQGSVASLVVSKEHSNLREVSAGRYCGIFHVADLSKPKAFVQVELRSPYGSLDRQELSDLAQPPCDLGESVELVQTSSKQQIKVTQVSDGKGIGSAYLIYRGIPEIGPFQKVAETKTSTWTDAQNPKGDLSYQVVCVDRRGVRSIPVAAVPKDSNTSS